MHLLDGHPLFAGVAPPAYSPDGTRLVTADGVEIKLWSVSDGRVLQRLPVHELSVRVDVAWHAAAGILLAPWQAPVMVLDPETLAPGDRPWSLEGTGLAPVVSPGGRFVAFCGQSWPVVWDVAQGCPRFFRTHVLQAAPAPGPTEARDDRRQAGERAIVACAFTADERTLLTVTAGGRLSGWDLERLRLVETVAMDGHCVAVHALSATLTLVVQPHMLRQYEWRHGSTMTRPLSEAVTCAALDPAARRLWLGRADGRIEQWYAHSLAPVALGQTSFVDEGGRLHSITCSPSGGQAAAVSRASGPVVLFSVSPDYQTSTLSRWSAWWAGLSMDDATVFLVSPTCALKWNLRQVQRDALFARLQDVRLQVLADFGITVHTDAHGQVWVRDMHTDTPLCGPVGRPVEHAAAAPGREWVALFDQTQVEVWQGRPAWERTLQGKPVVTATDAGGQWLVWTALVAGKDGDRPALFGYRTADGAALDLPSCTQTRGVAISRHGVLATPRQDGIRLWDVVSDRPAGTLPARGSCLHFSPSGDLLAVGGHGVVQVFRVSDGTRVARCVTGGLTLAIRFAPGERVLLMLVNGLLQMWALSPARPLGTLAHAERDEAWVVFTDDGRFDGSPGCERYLGGGRRSRVPRLLSQLLQALL